MTVMLCASLSSKIKIKEKEKEKDNQYKIRKIKKIKKKLLMFKHSIILIPSSLLLPNLGL